MNTVYYFILWMKYWNYLSLFSCRGKVEVLIMHSTKTWMSNHVVSLIPYLSIRWKWMVKYAPWLSAKHVEYEALCSPYSVLDTFEMRKVLPFPKIEALQGCLASSLFFCLWPSFALQISSLFINELWRWIRFCCITHSFNISLDLN